MNSNTRTSHDPGLTVQACRAVLFSHAWTELAPFAANPETLSLVIPFDLPAGQGCVRLQPDGDQVRMDVLAGDREVCEAIVRTCLSLDVDLSAFHSILPSEFAWIATLQLGRFLRSPSLYEDCFKAILNQGMRWAATIKALRSFVDSHGTGVGGYRAFPSPERVLGLGSAALRPFVFNNGRREQAVRHLCRTAMDRTEIYLDAGWRGMDAAAFRKELCGLSNVGQWTLDYLGRMYGKPIGYGMGSMESGACGELWGVEKKVAATFIADRYAWAGEHGPTAFWSEITRHRHEGGCSEGRFW